MSLAKIKTIVPDPQKILQFTWGYAPPLIIEAAIRNGLFDALDAGPKTIAQLAVATSASPRGIAAISNALVGMELLTRDTAGQFALTETASAFLVSSRPGYLGGLIGHGSTQLIPQWLQLSEIVRTGKPAKEVNQQPDGADFFVKFVADLFPLNYPSAIAAADALGMAHRQGPVRVLDLAAGSAVWSIAMAQRSQGVTVTAVDWPKVLDVTRAMVARFGFSERYQYLAGDLLEVSFGSGYQVATLGHILHSEGVQRSRELLIRVFEALAPGGTIVIGEFLVNADRRGPLMGLIFGVNMLVNTDDGDTFSFEEIREWLEIAGFRDVGVVEAPGPSPLIFANKPFAA